MDRNDLQVHSLPDIEMYAGDTAPWIVTLIYEDGSPLSSDVVSECACTMALTPYRLTGGASSVILTKEGLVDVGANGAANMVFRFTPSDTIALRGKFIYQIDVVRGADLRVCQGHLLIKHNINQ